MKWTKFVEYVALRYLFSTYVYDAIYNIIKGHFQVFQNRQT